jgi:hypothetical protein
MNTPFILNALMAVAICISQPACIVPVNTTYETARSLGKNNVELAGNFTQYSFAGPEVSGKATNNFGFRAGLGITDKFDLKIRYENMATPPIVFLDEDWSFDHVSFVSISPKFSLVKNKLSLSAPLSVYLLSGEVDGTNKTNPVVAVGPTLLYTAMLKPDKIDMTGGTKLEIFEGGGVVMGLSAGAGFSNNLNNWAIRPEIGVSTGLTSGLIFNYGIGTQFILHAKRNQAAK